MEQQIKQLTPRHLKIVDLAVSGLTTSQIAKQLNMHGTSVSMIINSPTFKHEFAIRRAIFEERHDEKQIDEEDEVTRTLREGARRAAEKLVGHLDSVEDSISVKSAEAILDRSGYGKKTQDKATVLAPTIIINEKEGRKIVETMEMIDG